MSDPTTLDPYGALTEPATLTIRRLLPGPVERVWAYLTENDLRRLWLAEGHMELTLGAPFELVWRNNDLSNSPDNSDEERMRSHTTELDPLRRLSIAWDGSGDVSFELEPQGEQVLLTLTHRRLPDRVTLLEVGAGWHMHLDILAARAAGKQPEPFWDGWRRLRAEYDRRMPA